MLGKRAMGPSEGIPETREHALGGGAGPGDRITRVCVRKFAGVAGKILGHFPSFSPVAVRPGPESALRDPGETTQPGFCWLRFV